MIKADRGFITFLALDFGFWLLGRSDRGSQRPPENFPFSLLCAGCHAVEKMTRNSEALELDVAISLFFFLVSARFCFDTDAAGARFSKLPVITGPVKLF